MLLIFIVSFKIK